MKELSIKEKAKRYDEAVKVAKYYYDEGKTLEYANDIVSDIFPELKESEDDRIKSAILEALMTDEAIDILVKCSTCYEDVESWLEKQGESKFEQCIQDGDKIVTNEDGTRFNVSQLERVAKKEPKFKVGDYLVNDYCKGKVIALTDDAYLLDTEQGIPFSCEHNAHLWTIRDANDGDVLAFKNNIGGIIICKSPTDYDTGSYCRFVSDNFINKEESGWDSTLLVPATKEQCELLFQKMKEAGYELDVEKKKLKKIEQRHAWSEEDEEMFDAVLADIRFTQKTHNHEVNQVVYEKEIDWLKSLKDRVQPQWKPSDEHIQALEYQVHSTYTGSWQYKASKELLEQLKKL